MFGAVIASDFAAPAAAQTPQTKVVKQKAVKQKAVRQKAVNYDGLWTVLIMTYDGPCDRTCRYPIRISRGYVQHAAATFLQHHRTGWSRRRRQRDRFAGWKSGVWHRAIGWK